MLICRSIFILSFVSVSSIYSGWLKKLKNLFLFFRIDLMVFFCFFVFLLVISFATCFRDFVIDVLSHFFRMKVKQFIFGLLQILLFYMDTSLLHCKIFYFVSFLCGAVYLPRYILMSHKFPWKTFYWGNVVSFHITLICFSWSTCFYCFFLWCLKLVLTLSYTDLWVAYSLWAYSTYTFMLY